MSWRNKRKTGVAVLTIGVMCLGVALLSRFSLPRSLQKRIVDGVCVSGVKHPHYDQWTNVTESTTKIYYWHIKNKEGFMYRREVPQFVERGPYVYTTLSRKVDVQFDSSGSVTYKTFQLQKFNQKMTTNLCPTCKENEKLNIINMAHLGLMNKVKTADSFSLVFLPAALENLLRDMDSRLGNRNATLKQLCNKTSFLQLNHSFNPEFGSWLYQKPLTCRCNRIYKVSEMRGLYNALVNPSVLGPPRDNAANVDCALKPHLKICGLFVWMSNVLLSDKDINSISPAFNKTEAKRLISHTLCPAPSACFPVRNIEIQVVFYFINALRAYTLWSMDHNNYGLVTTRSQNELALGYVMDKFRYPPAYPNGMHSPGVLKSHSSHHEAVQKSGSATLHPCDSSPEWNKFKWAAYNGTSEVSKVFYPNASASELKVSGHQSLFFPAKHVKSCDKSLYEPAAKKYEIFMAQLKRRGTIVYDKQVSVKKLTLKRFRLDESLVTANNRTVFTSGLRDMSSVYGFPILIGFPRFLHGEKVLGKKLGLPAADREKHGSFIDIEPFTGRALQAVFRFQVSTVVSSGLVSSQVHPKPLNVSYVEDNAPYYKNVMPLFWTETTHVISAQQAETFETQVFGTLSKFCGLMVIMFIATGFCLFVGLILVALSINVGSNTVSVDLTEN